MAVVEVPELEGLPDSELVFRVLEDGLDERARSLPAAATERMTAAVRASVRAPYEVVAARRGPREWSVAAREVRAAGIELPPVEAVQLTVALTPDGERTTLVDGEQIEESTGELGAALAELERRGGERYASFVARAERAPGGRWELTVDPL